RSKGVLPVPSGGPEPPPPHPAVSTQPTVRQPPAPSLDESFTPPSLAGRRPQATESRTSGANRRGRRSSSRKTAAGGQQIQPRLAGDVFSLGRRGIGGARRARGVDDLEVAGGAAAIGQRRQLQRAARQVGAATRSAERAVGMQDRVERGAH